MPLTTFVPEALGVVTICLVALLVLLGLFCIIYLFYFRSHIHNQGFIQLGYFSGPWIIRITFILFAILCGFGEIIRLSLLRQQGRVLNALNWKWQETVCKCYIVSNLGITEPCLFLTLVFLLRASLQKSESNTFSQKWNGKTAVYVLLYCLPMFLFQLTIILLGPHFNKGESLANKLPHYFTRTAARSKTTDQHHIALCTYPLLSTILLGLFATVITTYLFLLGRRILNLVINKGLQKRVYTLIFSISGFLPLRVIFLGLSVLSRPEQLPFEALAFCAFLSLLCCAGVGIFMLVYYPVADSLSLRSIPDIEARRSNIDEHNDMLPLIAKQSRLEEIEECSTGKWESISLQAMEREDSAEAFVELSLLSPSQLFTPPASPRWPAFPPIHVHGLGKQKRSDNHC